MKVIRVSVGPVVFAEDKDQARELRVRKLLPALEAGGKVVLDFRGVKYATQSFVHALVGEAIKRYGDEILARMEFRNCSKQLRSVIELVVDYSLSGFPERSMRAKAE
jgi:hypothetical protein